METVLQLCDSRNSNYPDYFEVFLSNCQKNFPKTFLANDYLFAAVYFIVLECGFCPYSVYDDFPHLCTDSFDVRKLRFITMYNPEHMKSIKTHVTDYWVYGIPLKLGSYRYECELQGVPSAEDGTYLIVNFILKQMGFVKSLCLYTENYIEKNGSSGKCGPKLKNLKELSLLTKNELCSNIKETIMVNEGQGCCPHLLRLPEDLQKKIIYFLIGNAVDVQYLASTCSYFYNVIVNDVKLWEKLCLSEFDGKILNEALLNAFEEDEDECNIFKKVFHKLKIKKLRRGYRFW